MESEKIYAIYMSDVRDAVKLLNEYSLKLIAIVNERGENWMFVKTVPGEIRYIKEHGPRPMITVRGD